MRDLPQQFIIDVLEKFGVDVPGDLYSRSFVHKIQKASFELPDRWHFSNYMDSINARYRSRMVVPIAAAADNDDTIAIVVKSNDNAGPIIHFHNYTDPGWEGAMYFSSFDDCLNRLLGL